MEKIEEPWCVRLQHQGGERIYEETKDLSREELLAWWEERNREFREYMAQLRAKREQSAAPVGKAG
jgi:hypothetical protein